MMDAKEAIKVLKRVPSTTASSLEDEAIELAISVLEKQIPKKPIHHEGDILCPSCNYLAKLIVIKGTTVYCEYCGQRIDWSDNHDIQA